MGNLSKSGITSGTTINSTYITNLYDFFTGTTAYDNINIADWDYINAGGIKGQDGFGFAQNENINLNCIVDYKLCIDFATNLNKRPAKKLGLF